MPKNEFTITIHLKFIMFYFYRLRTLHWVAVGSNSSESKWALLNGDNMMNENYEERIRFERVLSQSRRVPVKSLTGFAVESTPVTVKASGTLIFDDEGNFVEVASPSDAIVSCPHCGGNFPVDSDRVHEVRFCGWCGSKLGDE